MDRAFEFSGPRIFAFNPEVELAMAMVKIERNNIRNNIQSSIYRNIMQMNDYRYSKHARERQECIRVAAYYIAEKSGFKRDAMQCWLDAEKQYIEYENAQMYQAQGCTNNKAIH